MDPTGGKGYSSIPNIGGNQRDANSENKFSHTNLDNSAEKTGRVALPFLSKDDRIPNSQGGGGGGKLEESERGSFKEKLPRLSQGKTAIGNEENDPCGRNQDDFESKIAHYKSLRGKEKRAAITLEKANLTRLQKTIIPNYIGSDVDHAPAFIYLKEYDNSRPSLTLSEKERESFSHLTKINQSLARSKAYFEALGGYKHKFLLNPAKLKPVIVEKKVHELLSIGIDVAQEIINFYKRDVNNPGIKDDIKILSAFADSLQGGRMKDELIQGISELQRILGEPIKRIERAFEMCNEAISDEDLNDPSPFVNPGRSQKISRAYNLFTQNQMSQLNTYLKEMERDDIIDFAKRIYIENKDKINKENCNGLANLITRTIKQQSENPYYENKIQSNFGQWYK